MLEQKKKRNLIEISIPFLDTISTLRTSFEIHQEKKKKKKGKDRFPPPTMAKFTQSPMERSDVGLPY